MHGNTNPDELEVESGDKITVAFASYPGERPKETLTGEVTEDHGHAVDMVPEDGSDDYWDAYLTEETDRVRVYKDSAVVKIYHPDRGTEDYADLGQRAEVSHVDVDPEDAEDLRGEVDAPEYVPESYLRPLPCHECGPDVVLETEDLKDLAGWMGTNHDEGWERTLRCPECDKRGQANAYDDGRSNRLGAAAIPEEGPVTADERPADPEDVAEWSTEWEDESTDPLAHVREGDEVTVTYVREDGPDATREGEVTWEQRVPAQRSAGQFTYHVVVNVSEHASITVKHHGEVEVKDGLKTLEEGTAVALRFGHVAEEPLPDGGHHGATDEDVRRALTEAGL